MEYPKQVMSITELTKMGFSKTSLYEASKHPLAYHYVMYTEGKGKILIDTEQFEKYRRSVMR